MNRRNFLGLLVGGVAVAAARTFPFRVYSFPTEIVSPVSLWDSKSPKEILDEINEILVKTWGTVDWYSYPTAMIRAELIVGEIHPKMPIAGALL